LPNEILIVRNEGQAYEGLKNQLGGAQRHGQGVGLETDENNTMEAYSEMEASPIWIPGPVHLQIEAQTHMYLDFEVLYMVGKIMTRPFQCYRSQLQF
jgi:hypothetical protein